ncbi:MAG TPA: amidohydrolase family protein [Microbacterium sp.]|nr:amidohydrolase family protein [Microbacterium sp.]
MDVVDAQIHIGPDGIQPTLAAMDALGIQAVLVDEFWGRRPYGDPEFFEPGHALPNGAWRSLCPTAEAAALQHPERFATVLRVDRRDPDLEAVVRFAGAAPHIRALRVLSTWNPDEAAAFDSGAYAELFQLAADAGLPVFVYAPGHVESIAQYLRRLPALSLIVDHCGMAQPGLSIGRPEAEIARVESVEYFDEVLRLAEFPNVALKWSHEQVGFQAPEYPFAETRPFLRRAIAAFGADRILWASDKTVLPYTWSEILHSVRDNAELSAQEQSWILGGTLRRVLDWRRSEA